MKKNKMVLSFLIIALCLNSYSAFAGGGEQRVNQLIDAFKAYNTSKIERILDLDFMARRAMNLHWNKMSASQKKNFRAWFVKVVRKLAYKKTGKYFKNNKYAFVKEKTHKVRDYLFTRKKEKIDVISVSLTVDYKTGTGIKKEKVTFQLTSRGGKLIVFDVIMLDDSLVRDYRNQFSKTIKKKGGYDGLIKALKDKYNE